MNRTTNATKTNNLKDFSKGCRKTIKLLGKIASENPEFANVARKMISRVKGEIGTKCDDIAKTSFVAPREVPYALCERRLPSRIVRKGRGRVPRIFIFIFKGEYFTLREAADMFSLKYGMLVSRLHSGWGLVRAFGVENHRTDNYVSRNLEMMRV